jgi:hypothetical protein
MPKVVSNTTPIISLLKINHIHRGRNPQSYLRNDIMMRHEMKPET